MSGLAFVVKSSDGTGVYNVTASQASGSLRITCDCPAGSFGTHCRHRFELVSGDARHCIDPSPASIEQLAAMVALSPLRGLVAEIGDLDRQVEEIKRRLKALKKTTARVMAGAD